MAEPAALLRRGCRIDAADTHRPGTAADDADWESKLVQSAPTEEMLAIHEALDRLAVVEPTAAQLVKLRYFVGMTMDEAAEALGMPVRSAERMWTYARAWLRAELGEQK